MKVFAYSYRPFDEGPVFRTASATLQIPFDYTEQAPTLATVDLAAGCDYLSISTTPVDRALLDRFHAMGIRMIATCSVGYDHIDHQYARELGIHLSNSNYPPESVADYTVMLMLMALRNAKRILQRSAINDFTLPGLMGGLMKQKTVGVIGTGRIGRAVIQSLQGFGCQIFAYDKYPASPAPCPYLPLDELLRSCDILTLHVPLLPEDRHMIGRAELAKMKDGVILINTARGGLIDSKALVEALELGRVGACALDVVEDEFQMYYYDRRADVLGNHTLSILRDMPNVIVTPHMAFYTDQSVADMVHNCLLSCKLDNEGKENPFRVV